MKNLIISLFAVCTLASPGAWAAKAQDHAQIRDTVSAFVRTQTQAIPGKVSITVSEIDRRTTLPACPSLEAFMPPGTQLNGNSSVGVRCTAQHNWSLFVPVNVKISLTLLTTNKMLLQGHTLRAEDLGSLSSDTLQPGTLTDPAQAVGKIMKYSLAAGQILRLDMLRAPYTVKQGQAVQLKVMGAGFRVSSEGQALANAAEGDTTTARTASGQIISGMVKAGAIEVIQ